MNTVLLERMQHGLGPTNEKPIHHDLDTFFGCWRKDAGFDKAIKEFDCVDEKCEVAE